MTAAIIGVTTASNNAIINANSAIINANSAIINANTAILVTTARNNAAIMGVNAACNNALLLISWHGLATRWRARRRGCRKYNRGDKHEHDTIALVAIITTAEGSEVIMRVYRTCAHTLFLPLSLSIYIYRARRWS